MLARACAVGVVEVAGEGVDGHALRHGGDEVRGAVGGADADGVAERNLVATALEQGRRDLGNLGGFDLAFIRAAECAGNVAAYADAGGARGGEYGGESLQTLANAAVDVALRKRLGGSGEDGDFGGAGFNGGFEAAHVGDQNRVGDALSLRERAQNLDMIGHLRNPLGRNEGGGFNGLEAGFGRVRRMNRLRS